MHAQFCKIPKYIISEEDREEDCKKKTLEDDSVIEGGPHPGEAANRRQSVAGQSSQDISRGLASTRKTMRAVVSYFKVNLYVQQVT
jgi:hypothetical protein